MHGFRDWYMVASVLWVMCSAAGCGTHADTAATAMYDSANERYGTPDADPDATAEKSNTLSTADGHAQPQSGAVQESKAINTAESSSDDALPESPQSDEGTTTGAGSPSAAGDRVANNLPDALNDRVAQLEALVTQLQKELRQRQAENEVPEVISREQSSDRALANNSDESAARGSNDLSGPEPNRSGQPSAITRYARMDLDRLITRYKRARAAMMRSEASYQVDHFMTLVKSFEFLVRDTPQSFNALPERDMYAFRDLQEAADELVPELEFYLEDLASENERSEMEPLLSEAQNVTEMEPPGTGNRLLDFLRQLDEQHQSERQ